MDMIKAFHLKHPKTPFVPIDYRMESQQLLFHGNCKIEKKTEHKMDLGGIAKGYAVESIAKWLKK